MNTMATRIEQYLLICILVFALRFISKKMSIDFIHRTVAMWHFLPHYCIICYTRAMRTPPSCTIISHFIPLWNVLYVINSYRRSIAAFDDVCLRVYWMDWMFTQPLNYGFFTVPFLIWHPLSSPNKVLYHLWQSQRVRGLRWGQAVHSLLLLPARLFFCSSWWCCCPLCWKQWAQNFL